MQEISGEALAMYDSAKIEWCQQYINQMRDIQIRKFNEISARILEYIEVYTKLTPEELEKARSEKKQRKGDITIRETLLLVEDTQDLLFGIWANVQGRNFMSTKPTFEGKLPLNEQDADRKRYASALPMK